MRKDLFGTWSGAADVTQRDGAGSLRVCNSGTSDPGCYPCKADLVAGVLCCGICFYPAGQFLWAGGRNGSALGAGGQGRAGLCKRLSPRC